MAENGWKQIFDNTYLHNLSFYTQKLFYGPTSGVQLSFGIMQGVYYTHDPI
jgi:hypothetical protein